MTQTSDTLLRLQDVSKRFGKKTALDHISLEIAPGRMVGLLGSNGSGKSTLIKLINGLLVPSSGQIFICGQAPGPETKAIVSYLPERTYLPDTVRVKGLLSFFRDFYTDFDAAKAEEMLQKLDIDPSSPLKTLSKGTREKVQLIMVMSRRARVYILDEPIAGVDPAARDYILKTIIQDYNEDASILLSTHLIADVEQLLDDVIFLKDGQIILSSSVEEIRDTPFCFAEKGRTEERKNILIDLDFHFHIRQICFQQNGMEERYELVISDSGRGTRVGRCVACFTGCSRHMGSGRTVQMSACRHGDHACRTETSLEENVASGG